VHLDRLEAETRKSLAGCNTMLDLADVALITALGAATAEGVSRWRQRRAAKRAQAGLIEPAAPRQNPETATAAAVVPAVAMPAPLLSAPSLYANAIETLPIGIMIFDAGQKLGHANHKATDILGIDPAKLPTGTMLEDMLQLVVSTGRSDRDKAHEVAAGHVRLLAHLSPQVILTIRRDGKLIEIRLNRLDDGSVSATFEDIGVKQNAELALKRNQERFRDFAETSADWHWEADLEGRFTYLTPPHRTIAGIPASALLGCVWHDLFALMGAERNAVGRIAELIANHQPFTGIEFSAKSLDGTPVWIRAAGRPVYSENGALVACRGSGTDITAQKRAEAEVRQAKAEIDLAYRAKSQFLANMSHELRTPLNAIIGFSEMIRGEIAGPIGNQTYLQYANDINEAGGHLLTLINDILDLSKLEERAMDLDEQSVDIARLVNSAVRIVRGRSDLNRMTLTARVPSDVPTIMADELRLKQVLLNLLSNAIKFSPQESEVVIEVEASPAAGMTIKIRDQGIGISPEDIPVVLKPFGQVRSTVQQNVQGTGLGLSLSKNLVELHGGTITIESQKDKGTTVIVTLPPSRLRWPGDDSGTAATGTLRQVG